MPKPRIKRSRQREPAERIVKQPKAKDRLKMLKSEVDLLSGGRVDLPNAEVRS